MSQTTIPEGRANTLQWCRAHIAAWEKAILDGEPIGLSPEQVAQARAALDSAQEAYEGHTSAVSAARSARVRQELELKALRKIATNCVAAVRVKARSSSDPSPVYEAANVAPVRKRTPRPAPTPPTRVSLRLDNEGNVVVSWKSTRRNGDFFAIMVRTASRPRMQYVGSTSGRSFKAGRPPVGEGMVTYVVRAYRGGAVSESSQPVVLPSLLAA
jgi:hypothetical protein